MKKPGLWKIVLGALIVIGAGSRSPMDTLDVFGVIAGCALVGWGVAGYFRKKPAAPEPEPADGYRPMSGGQSGPDHVDYPFTNCGMREAPYARDFIVLDVETTGFSPRDDKVVEVSALKIRDGVETRFSTLVNPRRRIPEKAKGVNNITDDMAASAPIFDAILPDLDAFLDPALPIVGHNILSDLRFLWWEYHDAGQEMAPRKFIDTYKMAKKAFPDRESCSLASLIHDYHLIPGEQTHRADSDVDATLALYRLCCERLRK